MSCWRMVPKPVGSPVPKVWKAGLRGTRKGTGLRWLAIGPIVAGLLIFQTFPESAHRELEELNPDDVIDSETKNPLSH